MKVMDEAKNESAAVISVVEGGVESKPSLKSKLTIKKMKSEEVVAPESVAVPTEIVQEYNETSATATQPEDSVQIPDGKRRIESEPQTEGERVSHAREESEITFNLRDLKKKGAEELIALAESLGVENPNYL